ncbi:MAG: helix-turn-helix domain-containing protein, partial [Fidelibacterota bacterium]
RELKNCIERVVLLEKGDYITPSHINFGLPSNNSNLNFRKSLKYIENFRSSPLLANFSLDRLEKSLIKEALEITSGNKQKAAEILGITRETLKYRIKKFKIN